VKHIVQATYDACIEVHQVSCPCLWQSKECKLVLHHDQGIRLYDNS